MEKLVIAPAEPALLNVPDASRSEEPPRRPEALTPLQFEYLTEPVLFYRLRCPGCHGKVRRICRAPSAGFAWSAALGELGVWVVAGIGALLGYQMPAMLGLAIGMVAAAPPLVIWLYVRSISRGEFFCGRCRAVHPYSRVQRR